MFLASFQFQKLHLKHFISTKTVYFTTKTSNLCNTHNMYKQKTVRNNLHFMQNISNLLQYQRKPLILRLDDNIRYVVRCVINRNKRCLREKKGKNEGPWCGHASLPPVESLY